MSDESIWERWAREAEISRRAEKYIADAQQKQHGGDHYRKLKIQPIQYIQANGLGFHEGNVLKYITRWKSKNGLEDLRKAVHYLELLIEHTEKTESALAAGITERGHANP